MPAMEQQQRTFLLAEDNPSDVAIIYEMLEQAFGENCSTICVDRFDKAVEALTCQSFDSLILDMNLPDSSGVANIESISSLFPQVPVVVLTGSENQHTAADALQTGAQDYLTKNHVTPEILSRSINYASHRKRMECQLKSELKSSVWRNQQLENIAKHDALTHLPNRSYFQEAAERILHRASRLDKKVALLYFDLNGFKKINDTYGHNFGDKLLQQVSTRLERHARNTDFLARLGGDEFVIITDVIDDEEQTYPLVKRILKAFEQSFNIDSQTISCRPAIGVGFFPSADSLDLLIKHADSAMYEAKRCPDSRVYFYNGELAKKYGQSQSIELALSDALAEQQMFAHFQPVQSVNASNEVQVEALIRWNCAKLGQLNPADFIPIAENTPAINNISQLVIRHCQGLFQQLEQRGQQIDKMAINISASQLSCNTFSNSLLNWLEHHQLPPESICLELTEHQIVQNAAQCSKQLTQLQNQGIRIALDDFGSGFASITHLRDLPLNILKLDRVLIDRIDKNPRNQALTAGIVEMAHRLDMQVVAEGIEREEEYRMAIELGCDYLQGFYIAKPMPAEQLCQFYAKPWKPDLDS